MKHILWIEDETQFHDRAAELVNEALGPNYKVRLEPDLDAGLDYIRAAPQAIALIVLDLMMRFGRDFTDEEKAVTQDGERTGLITLKRIGDIKNDIPVVVLSVVRNTDVKEELGRNRQVKAVLTKPLLSTKLVHALREALGLQSVNEEAFADE